jgi:hypothetical protein
MCLPPEDGIPNKETPASSIEPAGVLVLFPYFN